MTDDSARLLVSMLVLAVFNFLLGYWVGWGDGFRVWKKRLNKVGVDIERLPGGYGIEVHHPGDPTWRTR